MYSLAKKGYNAAIPGMSSFNQSQSQLKSLINPLQKMEQRENFCCFILGTKIAFDILGHKSQWYKG